MRVPVTLHSPMMRAVLQVHRGVYEAAKLLYERYKPMVEEHLATSPFAKIAFIGHSLGGSLGSLLMLMFLHRGVIPVSAISPTYTFGAPAIFCEASGPGGTCALSMGAAPKALPDGKQQSSKAASAPVASKVSICLPYLVLCMLIAYQIPKEFSERDCGHESPMDTVLHCVLKQV